MQLQYCVSWLWDIDIYYFYIFDNQFFSLVIGEFDSNGIAQGTLGYNLGKVREFRFTVHSESGNWAILSEVCLLFIQFLLNSHH